jgi:mannitol/fructose-specific phosphotransferase system IIA component
MAITNGPNLNSTPAAKQQALSTNYLDLNTSGAWAQQYVPDLMEKEAEVFGPRTISGLILF